MGRTVLSEAAAALLRCRCIISRGPSGVGKSTLARAIAVSTGMTIVPFDASLSDHRDQLLASLAALRGALDRFEAALAREDYGALAELFAEAREVRASWERTRA